MNDVRINERLDSNGYSKSLFNTEQGECYLCGRKCESARHEVFFGSANRVQSKRYGMWVNLCPHCHEEVHRRNDVALRLKEEGQSIFESKFGHEKYMKLFGKNYL